MSAGDFLGVVLRPTIHIAAPIDVLSWLQAPLQLRGPLFFQSGLLRSCSCQPSLHSAGSITDCTALTRAGSKQAPCPRARLGPSAGTVAALRPRDLGMTSTQVTVSLALLFR